jgi:hypothetical protein
MTDPTDILRETLEHMKDMSPEYECFSCGEYKPMKTWSQAKEWIDNWGHERSGFFCEACIKAGKDKLVRP